MKAQRINKQVMPGKKGKSKMQKKREKSQMYATSFSYLIPFVFDLITAVTFTLQVLTGKKKGRFCVAITFGRILILCASTIWDKKVCNSHGFNIAILN